MTFPKKFVSQENASLQKIVSITAICKRVLSKYGFFKTVVAVSLGILNNVDYGNHDCVLTYGVLFNARKYL